MTAERTAVFIEPSGSDPDLWGKRLSGDLIAPSTVGRGNGGFSEAHRPGWESNVQPTFGNALVVGVDGSPESRDAMLLGRRLTQAAGGSLHLVTAVPSTLVEVAATRARLDPDRLRSALFHAAKAKVTASLQDDVEAADLDRLRVRFGRPEHVIAEAGRELGADGFVLGGRHRIQPVSWFRRATAHHLLRVSDRPILITGPGGSQVERVIAAVDRSFATELTVAVARRIAGLLGTSLEVMHVVARPVLPSEIDLQVDLDDWVRGGVEEAEAELRPLLPDDAGLTVIPGEVIPSLVEIVEVGPPTLLVVGAQGRGWIHRLLLGSTTESLVARLPASLVVVPSSPPQSPAVDE